jgi:hypothetical protein
MFEPMSKRLSPRKQGEAEIKILQIGKSEADFSRIREAATGGREQAIPEGTYAQLFVGGQLVMSDTPMEQRTNTELLARAHGRVLIAGLGLGMVLVPLLQKPEVESILVFEKSEDVIDLVAPAFQKAIDDERLFILCEDIYDVRPDDDEVWNTLYFDIWPDITADNLPGMERIANTFRWHLDPEDPKAWMGFWGKKEAERARWEGY